MLTDLLQGLDSGTSYSQDELARLTGTSRENVMAQIDYLTRLGYLKRISLTKSCSESGGCKGCSGCATGGSGIQVFWERSNDPIK